ncbi:hypothetical protein KCU74_g87, partial [Aureobasidium melanogenum]
MPSTLLALPSLPVFCAVNHDVDFLTMVPRLRVLVAIAHDTEMSKIARRIFIFARLHRCSPDIRNMSLRLRDAQRPEVRGTPATIEMTGCDFRASLTISSEDHLEHAMAIPCVFRPLQLDLANDCCRVPEYSGYHSRQTYHGMRVGRMLVDHLERLVCRRMVERVNNRAFDMAHLSKAISHIAVVYKNP